MGKTAYVIGGGLSGLSAAVTLVRQGWIAAGGRIALHEGGVRAGGRCRSYHDGPLDCMIDNGNHLMLGAYTDTLSYARETGGAAALYHAPEARFDFVDLDSQDAWRLRINDGRLPWWVLFASRRIPGSRIRDYGGGLALLRAKADQVVSDCLSTSDPLFRRLWQPFIEGVMNATAEQASASLLGHVVMETFGKGGKACRPVIARSSLAEALVDPALAFLEEAGVEIRFQSRLKALQADADGRISRLLFGEAEAVELTPEDRVVLAVPAPVAKGLLPNLSVPEGHRAIANVHFRLPAGTDLAPWFAGLVGSQAQWLFMHGQLLSVTISVADHLNAVAPETLAEEIWEEVRTAIDVAARNIEKFPDSDYGHAASLLQTHFADGETPPFRVVKEKRATFLQTPEQVQRRPGCRTSHGNLFLAGDWTDTGLPATIEGAIRSGRLAGELAGEQAVS